MFVIGLLAGIIALVCGVIGLSNGQNKTFSLIIIICGIVGIFGNLAGILMK